MTRESLSEPAIQLQKLPLLSGNIFAQNLNLTEYVLSHSPSCYFIKVEGESMRSMNIHDGDLLVVDRNLSAEANDLVIALEDDKFQLMQASAYDTQQYSLSYELSATTQKKPIQLWGVVTYIIHHCR
ncbi:MAG: S24 family peptidase [Tunicatimonas sp.]|uniref:LexA family protein n=1 Tax=Tunicatimonas sp. TaxID=1940096 RepID=UPI003C7539B8